MNDKGRKDKEEVFSKVMRAGKRTYFFDVRATRADDYYITITESRKQSNDDGSAFYKKHKIFLYKEDFIEFFDTLQEVIQFVADNKGEDYITSGSEAYEGYDDNQDLDNPQTNEDFEPKENKSNEGDRFTNVSFDDL